MHPVQTERTRLLVQLEQMFEKPLLVLSFAWLVLAVLELTSGLSPIGHAISTSIWILFIGDFLLKLVLAPDKTRYLRRNWISALSLALPALRLFRLTRLFRAARVLRGIRLAKFLSSMNRGMRALRRSMRRRGFNYVVALTLLVLFAGAAGMMSFEREGTNAEVFKTYSGTLWWTAMLMTTLGSEYWPRTGSGRLLTLVIALYSFGVFGYITATLASFFIDRDESERQTAGARKGS